MLFGELMFPGIDELKLNEGLAGCGNPPASVQKQVLLLSIHKELYCKEQVIGMLVDGLLEAHDVSLIVQNTIGCSEICIIWNSSY